MSDQNVKSLRTFENFTGRDTTQADVTYERPVTFTNHATLFFACNDLPALDDDTRGHWRRWSLIWFTETFNEGDEDHIPRAQLDRELTVQSEMEGLLARCIEEIKAWDQGRAWFPDVDDWETTRREMRKASEPVFGYAGTCLKPSDVYLPKEDVRQRTLSTLQRKVSRRWMPVDSANGYGVYRTSWSRLASDGSTRAKILRRCTTTSSSRAEESSC